MEVFLDTNLSLDDIKEKLDDLGTAKVLVEKASEGIKESTPEEKLNMEKGLELVKRIAEEYHAQHANIPVEDFVGEGLVGLSMGIEWLKFDPQDAGMVDKAIRLYMDQLVALSH